MAESESKADATQPTLEAGEELELLTLELADEVQRHREALRTLRPSSESDLALDGDDGDRNGHGHVRVHVHGDGDGDGDAAVCRVSLRLASQQDKAQMALQEERNALQEEQQSFLLRAVFELVQSKLAYQSEVLEGIRLRYPELPPSSEAIMYGDLRRVKPGGTFFVVVAPGQMMFVASALGASSSLPLFNKPHKREPVKSMRLAPGTWCRALDAHSSKKRFCFEIVGGVECASPTRSYGGDVESLAPPKSSERRLWTASSNEDRLRWMRVINDAANTIALSAPPSLEDAALDRLHARTKAAQTVPQYLAALSDMFKLASTSTKRLEAPLEWAHSKLNLPRGGQSDDAGTQMQQVFKDMQRDKVSINGHVFQGWVDADDRVRSSSSKATSRTSMSSISSLSSSAPAVGPAICAMVCALAREIQRHSNEVELTEAEALTLSHQVLSSCSRTQSGGNTLDVVTLLCGHDSFAFIASDSADVQPLQIRVYSAESESEPALAASPCARPTKRPAKPTPQSAHATMHRKTSSEGEFVRGAEASRSTTPTTPLPAAKLLQTDILKSIAKMRHRRRASEPLHQPQMGRSASAPSSPTGVVVGLGLGLDKRQPVSTVPASACARVALSCTMHYKICNPSFSDEHDAVWTRIRATYTRTFALLATKAVALSQGSVELVAL